MYIYIFPNCLLVKKQEIIERDKSVLHKRNNLLRDRNYLLERDISKMNKNASKKKN